MQLSWKGDILKDNLRPGLTSSLIFKGILALNRQLVGFLASSGLQIPWPEEASMKIVILNTVHVLPSGMLP